MDQPSNDRSTQMSQILPDTIKTHPICLFKKNRFKDRKGPSSETLHFIGFMLLYGHALDDILFIQSPHSAEFPFLPFWWDMFHLLFFFTFLDKT